MGIMPHDPAIATAVVGVGRMGRHHARIYHQLQGVDLVAVVDRDPDQCRAVAEQSGCDACESCEQLLERHPEVRAVSVAVPTSHHLPVAGGLLERGVACLVEKPLAANVAQSRRIVEIAEKSGAILQAGHTERFNPAVRAMSKLDVTVRFMEIDRVSPMTFRSLDIGVVMDMMIHDLDIALMLARSPLARVDAAGVAVLGTHEDVANARLIFESGCVANLTASRLALKTHRRMRVFSEQAYITLDYQNRSGLIIRKSDNADALAEVRARLAAGDDLSNLDYAKLVNIESLRMDGVDAKDDPLTAELASFIEAVRGGGRPEVDGAAGYAAVEVAERVVAAVSEHQWDGLSPPHV